LQNYLPGRARAGQAITDPALIQYLVPNDSKMYQMKLALWRLLENNNAQMLSQMRVGAAGNFFDYLYGVTIAEGTTLAMKAVGDPPSGEGDPPVPYDIPILHYWKEKF
jgi:hypothetical protein